MNNVIINKEQNRLNAVELAVLHYEKSKSYNIGEIRKKKHELDCKLKIKNAEIVKVSTILEFTRVLNCFVDS